VPNDNNHSRDVFLSDLTTGTISLISVATDGTQANFDSGGLGAGPAQVSPDGHYVVFGSFASTLVPNDNNNADDIFVRDRDGNTTERVSVSTDATEANGHSMYGSISADGRYVVYFALADNLVPSDNNEAADVFLRDRQTGATTRLSGGTGASEANGPSRFPAISSDGKHVAYQSDASNLVPDDGNSRTDIFLYELQSTGTQRISVPTAGGEAHDNSTFAAIDGDGSAVVFQSLANDLVPGDGNSVGDVFAWGKPTAPVLTPTRTPTAQATPTPTPEGCHPSSLGDANGDGHVNSIDAALILQFTAGLLPSISPNADANQDGRTNAIDALVVLQFGAGLLTCLPP
jgi:Tol biopolymer transport system component